MSSHVLKVDMSSSLKENVQINDQT